MARAGQKLNIKTIFLKEWELNKFLMIRLIFILLYTFFFIECHQSGIQNNYQIYWVHLQDETYNFVFLKNNIDTLYTEKIEEIDKDESLLSAYYHNFEKDWSCQALRQAILLNNSNKLDLFYQKCFIILQEQEDYKLGEENRIVSKWLEMSCNKSYVASYDTIEWENSIKLFTQFLKKMETENISSNLKLDSCESEMYNLAFIEIGERNSNEIFLTKRRLNLQREVLLSDYYQPILYVEKIVLNNKQRLVLKN